METLKKIFYSAATCLIIAFSLSSCLKEDTMSNPTLKSMKMYMLDKSGKDSLVTLLVSGKAVKFVVETSDDICSIWPGGVRSITKMKNSTVDSLDMYNHPVLISSDCYTDYGLVGAKGFKTTQNSIGWYASYTYKTAGSFDVTIVLTNNGYQDASYKQVVIPFGKVTVR